MNHIWETHHCAWQLPCFAFWILRIYPLLVMALTKIIHNATWNIVSIELDQTNHNSKWQHSDVQQWSDVSHMRLITQLLCVHGSQGQESYTTSSTPAASVPSEAILRTGKHLWGRTLLTGNRGQASVKCLFQVLATFVSGCMLRRQCKFEMAMQISFWTFDWFRTDKGDLHESASDFLVTMLAQE